MSAESHAKGEVPEEVPDAPGKSFPGNEIPLRWVSFLLDNLRSF